MHQFVLWAEPGLWTEPRPQAEPGTEPESLMTYEQNTVTEVLFRQMWQNVLLVLINSCYGDDENSSWLDVVSHLLRIQREQKELNVCCVHQETPPPSRRCLPPVSAVASSSPPAAQSLNSSGDTGDMSSLVSVREPSVSETRWSSWNRQYVYVTL